MDRQKWLKKNIYVRDVFFCKFQTMMTKDIAWKLIRFKSYVGKLNICRQKMKTIC